MNTFKTAIITLEIDKEIPSYYLDEKKLKSNFKRILDYSKFNLKLDIVSEGKQDDSNLYLCPTLKTDLNLFKLTAMGLNSKEISEQIFRSSRTIETYLSNTRKFYDCKNSTELIYFLVKNKLLIIEEEHILKISQKLNKHLELFYLIASGLTYKKAGLKIGLSARTIEKIVQETCDLYDCRNKTHLIYLLTLNGLI